MVGRNSLGSLEVVVTSLNLIGIENNVHIYIFLNLFLLLCVWSRHGRN